MNGNERLRISFDKKLKIKKFKGNENPIMGWYSPEFGVKKLSYLLVGEKISKIDPVLELRTKVSLL